jgi:hypothetical protein
VGCYDYYYYLLWGHGLLSHLLSEADEVRA